MLPWEPCGLPLAKSGHSFPVAEVNNQARERRSPASWTCLDLEDRYADKRSRRLPCQ